MAIVQALARLTHDDLKVEAGTTVETTIEVGAPADAWPEGFQEYSIRVEGLPEGWYTLSTEVLRVPGVEWGEALLVIHPPHNDPSAPLGEYEFAVQLTPLPDGRPTVVPGRVVVLAPGGIALHSRLLQYLPGVYRSDTFLARFLLIFQSILDPIEREIDTTHLYLDPELTPARFLPWLASWLDVTLDPNLDESQQRTLIVRAVELARWKGTRRALREELQIRTGGRPLIVENFDGMRLGQDASLGLNTHLGVRRDQWISVTLAKSDGQTVNHQQVDHLVNELKPVHVGHVVRVVAAPSTLGGDGHG